MSSNASQSLDGLVLRIDNATNSYLIAQNFTYTPNPTIQSIYPGKGLKHGGVALEVIGTWLNSVQNPKILFQNDEWSASGDCKNSKINQSVMTCQQPSVLQSVAQGGHVLLNVTFVMDGVPQSSLQLPDPFFIKPDPVFRFLDDDLTIGTNNYILLKGKNLNVLEQQFYTIYLGRSKVCNIIIFTEDVSFFVLYLFLSCFGCIVVFVWDLFSVASYATEICIAMCVGHALFDYTYCLRF